MLNSPDAVFALGLLDAARPQPVRTPIGSGLLQAFSGAQQFQQGQEDRKLNALFKNAQIADFQSQAAERQAHAQDYARKSAQEQRMRDLAAQYWRPAQPTPPGDPTKQALYGQQGYSGAPPSPAGPGFDFQGYAQALAQYDPLMALKLQDSLRKDTSPITLKAGEQLLDRDTLRPLAGNPKDETPDAVRQYQFAVSQGYNKPFSDWITEKARAGASNTTVSYGAPVAGVDTKGNPVFFQPDKAGGAPSIVPGVTPPPKDLPASTREKLAENTVTLGKIDAAIAAVRQHPDSFGLANVLGDTVQQRRDPQGVTARAMVADIGSQKLHDRSGASVTASETPRLKPFIPNVNDHPDTIVQKLTIMQREAAAMQQALNSGATLQQVTAPAAPVAPAAGGVRRYNPATGKIE